MLYVKAENPNFKSFYAKFGWTKHPEVRHTITHQILKKLWQTSWNVIHLWLDMDCLREPHAKIEDRLSRKINRDFIRKYFCSIRRIANISKYLAIVAQF